MFNLKQQKKKGFTTVEILVAVGLVAILMVVAVPRLLGTRQSVGDSAAKQQLNTVGVAVNNWFVERDTFVGMDLAKINARVPEVQIVDGNAPTGKQAGGRALSVGFSPASASEDSIVLVASNGDNNCWGIRYDKTGVSYAFKVATPANCNPAAARTGWDAAAGPAANQVGSTGFFKFEFPPATN
jgi:type II secretory pathway pseudopilin PulG